MADSFDDLIQDYLAHLVVERNLSPRTLESYARDLRQFREWIEEMKITCGDADARRSRLPCSPDVEPAMGNRDDFAAHFRPWRLCGSIVPPGSDHGAVVPTGGVAEILRAGRQQHNGARRV